MIRQTKAFQSTHPRGVRRTKTKRQTCDSCFNPRTRVGCDARKKARLRMYKSFNPRTRVGCDRFFILERSRLSCFNPRTRVGCDEVGSNLPYRRRVSIHAPAWGATRPRRTTARPREVSIHAPAWGATADAVPPLLFSSVSIHAPAWGATGASTYCFTSYIRFNPRTRVGCDRQAQFK